ncbi:MAG TPA: 6-phosphogluconolactonase [Thermoleophilaceae bacterium]
MQPELQILDDPATEAAARLVAANGHVVLTGGSTPRGAYELAAERRPDWTDTELWFTDERAVGPEHEFSNYGMVKAALLDRVRTGPVHRMRGELGPHEGAAEYAGEYELAGSPHFDLVLVGLGPDAHVCSLFPGDDALSEIERPVVGVDTPGMAPLLPRITLTLPVVNAAAEVLVLVKGEDKADAVARAFSGRPDPRAPGSLLRPTSGTLTVLLDPAAAARLEAAR